ncbi:MAG: ribonuclease D, partial [Planctomycetes bacterium]|nr:ribonuclease D [Planctomycetota bacterium]
MEQSVLSSSADYIYIDTFSAMDPLLEAIGQANRVALDIEADSLHHYFEKVCLIQLSIGSSHYIVDPLSVGDLSPLWSRLADKALIVHDGGYDLRMLRASFGFVYRGPLFDTQLAAQLAGYERFSLVNLVDQLLGVRLSKSGQKSDWSVRPLTAKQIQYAVNDTRHLEAIADIFSDQLAKSGRSDWLRQSAGALLDSIAQEKTPRNANDMWRIKGLRDLERRQLAFVSQLWSWREDQARQFDRPPFKVMDNSLLRELAIWASANSNANMDRGPKLPRHCTGS